MADVTLRAGDASAVVRPQGAALERYAVGDVLVIGAEPPLPPEAYPGSVLAPWANRLTGGIYTFAGTEHRVPINEPERNASLHGLVAFREWDVEHATGDAVSLRLLLGSDPGYPFVVALHARYRLDADGLTATIEARNEGDRAAPVGLGAHPYLAVPGGMDEATLEGRPLRGVVLDDAMGDLARDEHGRVSMLVELPGHRVRVWGGPTCRWFMVFTADTLGARWRRRVLALEPMTCAPEALRTGEIDIVEPGRTLALDWGVRFER